MASVNDSDDQLSRDVSDERPIEPLRDNVSLNTLDKGESHSTVLDVSCTSTIASIENTSQGSNENSSDALIIPEGKVNAISKEKMFSNFCDDIERNPRSISFPGEWIPQVIRNVAMPCIMWVLWAPGYVRREKYVILFTDMTASVSIGNIRKK